MAKADKPAAKQLNASSPEVGLVALVLFLILIPLIYYFMFYSDLATKKKNTISRIATLQNEIVQLKDQESQLVEIRKEKERLESRLNLLRAKIPSTADELNYFLDSVNQRARSSRVNKWILFKQEGLIPHGEYSSLPIRMEFEATYEATIQFFWDLATMGDGMKNNSREQIININEVQINRAAGDKKDGVILLRVNCVAETYLYTGATAATGGK